MDYNYHKKFCLLCSECNCLSDNSASVFFGDVEVAKDFYMEFSNEYYCKICNKVTFQYDIEPGIAMSVRLLRLNGYDTRFSCEGHSKLIFSEGKYLHDTSFPYICFVQKELPENFERILNVHNWKLQTYMIEDEGLYRLGYEIENKVLPIEEYVEYHNKEFRKADKELFNALLEIFRQETPE